MVRRASRIIQAVRDSVLLVLSAVLISTSIGSGKELANLFFAGICAVILILTVVNVVLNVLKVQRKVYFRGNSIFQLIIGIFLSLSLFPPLGIILIAFNVAVLVSLWEKKASEELVKHPPKPVTKKYRILVGVGVLTMFVALLFSWLNTISFPLMGFYLGTVNLSAAANTITNTMAMAFGFFAIVIAPISIIAGLLGLFKGVFARVSGILAVIAGAGWIVSMATITGLGAYIFAVGGVLVLAAPIAVK